MTCLSSSWGSGLCLLTLGTGKLSPADAVATGLIASHNYAVLGSSVLLYNSSFERFTSLSDFSTKCRFCPSTKDLSQDSTSGCRTLTIVNTWTRRMSTSEPSSARPGSVASGVVEAPDEEASGLDRSSWTQELRSVLEGVGEDGM